MLDTILIQQGVPPALPGRQSNFENSGSMPPVVAVHVVPGLLRNGVFAVVVAVAFHGCEKAPLRGQQP